MKIKISNVNALFLLLALTIKPMSLFAMETKEDDFGSGFGKGFLSRKNKSSEKKVSAPAETVSAAISIPTIAHLPEFEKKSTAGSATIWDNPQYQGADALNFIFSVLEENMKGLEPRNLKHLTKIRGDIVALLSNPRMPLAEYKEKVAAYYFFHILLREHQMNILIVGGSLPQHPNYLMHYIPVQQMDHAILFSLLQRKNPSQNGLITAQSTLDKGELVSNLHFDSSLRPNFSYYTENVGGTKYYRTYLEGNNKFNCMYPLKNSPYFKGFQFTDIAAHDTRSTASSSEDDRWEWSGYILNKDGSLVEEDGIVLTDAIEKTNGPNAIQAFRYGLSPSIGQHRFLTISPAREKDALTTAPYLEALVTLAGGFDKIKHEGLVFLPHPLVRATEPTSTQATFLLPYLYEIRGEDTENEELNAVILYAESIIVDAEYAKEGSASKADVENEIRKAIEKEISDGSPLIITEIDTKAASLNPEYVRPTGKQKWKVKSKTARDGAVAALKEEKIESRMAGLAKEICEKHLQEVSKPHYGALAAKAIRDALLNDFEKNGIITITGETTQRGSHVGTEISTNNKSTKVGLAERSQKRGFYGSTVKNVLNQCLESVLTLLSDS